MTKPTTGAPPPKGAKAAPKKPAARTVRAPKEAPPIRIPKRPTPDDQIPRVVRDPTPSDHLAVISRAVFQAGMSWAFIEARWGSYLAAFDGFDLEKVAVYDDAQVERLLNADGIIRSRAKIEGTIRNARTLIELGREFGSIAAYQTSFADYAAIRKDAQKRFAFMGDLNVYYWLFRTGAPVPDLEEWMRGQERDHPRMREMVRKASATPDS
jgi:3-methyladenine DNA glycosylase Tag